MIPAAFDYARAGSAEEAIALLVEHGDEAKLIAGGHSLLPLMKLRLAIPAVLIDIGRVPDLSYIEERGDEIAIGALARHHDLETSALLKEQVPLLAYTAHQVGDPQVRHRGTLGGTLAHGDPASDLPAAVLALGGTLVAQGPDGRREIAAADFFRGFLETALAADEMLVEMRVPKVAGRRMVVPEVQPPSPGLGHRRRGRGRQRHHRHRTHQHGIDATAGHGGRRGGGSGASAADAAAVADQGTDPPSDINASSEYRRHLATVLVRRALEEATS